MLLSPIYDPNQTSGFRILSPEEEVTDAHVDSLLDDYRLGEMKRLAEQQVKPMGKELWHKLRARCKRDLFYLTYGVLGYKRLSLNLHADVCNWIEQTEHERFRMFLFPRAHFKSTIITIAHNIQYALPYTKEDEEYDEYETELDWHNRLGPNIRILLAHEVHEQATKFLFSITQHITSNPLLMGLFPEIVPDRKKQKVNKLELELPRDTYWMEATFDTMGVGGKSQGKHYNIIDLDDIYGDKARESETEKKATKDWVDNIQSFFDVLGRDKLKIPGTRYDYDDVYGHLIEVYGSSLKLYKRSVIEPYPQTQVALDSYFANPEKYPEIKPIFSEEVTPESLRVIRKNKKVWVQYSNEPGIDGVGFKEEWEKLFYWKTRNTIIHYEDEAQKIPTYTNIRDCSICILIDPGQISGGLEVVATDYLMRHFILVALRIDMDPPSLTNLVFNQVARWQPHTVAIESDVFAHTYQHWWRAEMRQRGLVFNILPVFTKKTSKEDRIEGLSQYYEAGHIFHNENQDDLRREYKQYGRSKDIHILDAEAYGPEVWKRGHTPGWYKLQENQIDVEGPDVDVLTGYSPI